MDLIAKIQVRLQVVKNMLPPESIEIKNDERF